VLAIWIVAASGVEAANGRKKQTRQQKPAAAAAMARYQDAPEVLRDLYVQREVEGTQSWVLSSNRIGLRALRHGLYREAEAAFDDSLNLIETIYANTESAARARSLWHEEGAKDFKGEPYERAMAYLYRALLYVRDGELDTARATARAGVLQDAFAEEEQFRCDFFALAYLDGLLSAMLGDHSVAGERFVAIAESLPGFQNPGQLQPPLHLVVVETGRSPRKVADGLGHAELKYRRGRNFSDELVRLAVAGETQRQAIGADLFWQASTRGGRPVDKILEGKVHFQASTAQAGDSLARLGDATAAAALARGSTGTMNISSGLSALGGVAMLMAAKAKPHADTRYWDTLPDRIFFWILPGSQAAPVEIEYLDAQGEATTGLDPVTISLDSCMEDVCLTFISTPHAG
jgi:tetratricopeptide (TPR) repeat protein